MSNRVPFLSGAVPIPNRLFDEILLTLPDAELRVLLVVLRQTLGFREGSDLGGWRYKQRDWITHSQLMKKTGRSSGAVSKAISALVDASLIIVEDSEGRPLDTPQMRRRHMGRLYFRPVEMWEITSPAHIGKSKTTTDTLYNIKRKKKQTVWITSPHRRGRGWQRAAHPER